MINYSANGKVRNAQIYLVVISIVIASVLGLVTTGMSSFDNYLWVIIAVIAGITIFVIGLIMPVISIYMLVFASAFIGYRAMLEARLFIENIPINLIEVTMFLSLLFAFPSLLLGFVRKDWKYRTQQYGTFALWIVFLGGVYMLGFIRGVVLHSLYSAGREFRPIILIAIAFFLTRKYVTSWKTLKTIVIIIFLGGIYGMIYNIIIPILTGIQHITYFKSYLDIRSIGSASASFEFTFILGVAFIVCRHYLFGRRSLTWILVLMSFWACFLSFSMSAYAFTILVPLLCVLLAPLQLSKKLKIGLAMAGLPIIVLYYGVTTFTEIGGGQMFGDVPRLFGQAAEQLLGLSSSIHFQGRLYSWNATLSELSGIQFLVGVGMGKRIFIGIPQLGIVLIGEPTYSTYLLGVGLTGLIVLLALQLKFVVVSYHNMRYPADSFIRAVMLAFPVYGIITIINGFLHNNFIAPQGSVLYGILLGLIEVMGWIGADERRRRCTRDR